MFHIWFDVYICRFSFVPLCVWMFAPFELVVQLSNKSSGSRFELKQTRFRSWNCFCWNRKRSYSYLLERNLIHEVRVNPIIRLFILTNKQANNNNNNKCKMVSLQFKHNIKTNSISQREINFMLYVECMKMRLPKRFQWRNENDWS